MLFIKTFYTSKEIETQTQVIDTIGEIGLSNPKAIAFYSEILSSR